MAINSTDSVTLSAPAGAQITRFRFVKFNAAGEVIPVAAVTDIPVGVALESVNADEAAAKKAVTIQIGGIAKVENAGSAIATSGTIVAASANGRLQTGVATQYPMGITIAPVGATAELASVLLRPCIRVA